ncbi:MAG: VUT family protein [Bacteroidia bacterium]|nr:VUT family protein [Bacteroidia bacterium]
MPFTSLVNSFINMLVAKHTSKDNFKAFAARSFVSTALSQFVDNLLFALIVSVPLFGWSIKQSLLCSLVAAGFELCTEAIFSGVGYKLSLSLKDRESTVLK